MMETCLRSHHPLAKKHLKQQVIDWHWNWNVCCSTAKTTWSQVDGWARLAKRETHGESCSRTTGRDLEIEMSDVEQWEHDEQRAMERQAAIDAAMQEDKL